MPASITVNGQSLEALSFYVSFGPGLLEGPSVAAPVAQLAERAGGLLLSPRETSTRTIVLQGSIDPAARTVAAAWSASRTLKDLFFSGLLTLVFTDTAGNVVQWQGVCTEFAVEPRLNQLHFQSATVLDLKVTLIGDATMVEVEPTIRSVAAAATRYDIPLGTAPSDWILRVMGAATNPVVTYRLAGGVSGWALTFTATLAATNDWIDLDATRGRIWQYASGVKTDGIALLTAGQQDWPRPLDPHDGDYATSQWPTIEVSAGTAELLWRKRYL